MPKALVAVLVSTLFLTGCVANENDAVLNSGRTDISRIQENFRQSILANYVDVVVDELAIAEAISPNDASFEKVEESEELKAWRQEISEPWNDLQNNQRDLMCEFFYQGILDEKSDFAYIFVEANKQFKREGTVIHSINNIRMREDNRKTIQLPTANYSSSLFVCSARIVLKLSNGYFSQPLDSTLAWNYYLSGGQRKFTFTFKLRS
jgi:hypothetical protein